MSLRNALLPVLLLLSSAVYGQDFSYPLFSLQTTTFSGGNLSIRKDDGTGHYGLPQYSKDSLMPNPVAYVSGDVPRVAATFSVLCTHMPDSVWLRGTGPDTLSFAAKKVAITGTGGAYQCAYPATNGSHAFAPGKVNFYKPFTIHWQVSFDGTTWRTADSSQNTLYVTRAAPMPESGSYRWFQTVYDLSCRNAVLQSTDTGIISHVWSEFTDQVVLNWAGDSLFYYKDMTSPNVTLGSLLKYHDAECYTFAQLFLSAIKIQGVVRTGNYVYITPVGNTVCGYPVNRFLVKNWSFGTPTGGAVCAQFPYVNTYYGTYLPYPYTAYVFTSADVTDQDGLPGPCNSNPASYFNNHQIAKIDGRYYDACYGVSYTTLAAYTTASLQGWGFRFTSGGITRAHFTNDLTKSWLDETISTF